MVVAVELGNPELVPLAIDHRRASKDDPSLLNDLGRAGHGGHWPRREYAGRFTTMGRHARPSACPRSWLPPPNHGLCFRISAGA
jgi:hypothetical protein